jgi:hypothetical protein
MAGEALLCLMSGLYGEGCALQVKTGKPHLCFAPISVPVPSHIHTYTYTTISLPRTVSPQAQLMDDAVCLDEAVPAAGQAAGMQVCTGPHAPCPLHSPYSRTHSVYPQHTLLLHLTPGTQSLHA